MMCGYVSEGHSRRTGNVHYEHCGGKQHGDVANNEQ
jgi:hypothetical protein